MMRKYHLGPAFFGIAMLSLPLVTASRAETLVQQNVDNRISLAFRVPESRLRAWLPTPWQANSVSAGPSKGANISVSFIDQLLSQDAEGKLLAGGTNRIVGLSVPAKHAETGETALIVIRLYTANPQYVPGPYKNSVQTRIQREAMVKGADLEPGVGSEVWSVQDASGGRLDFRLEYERGIPSRAKSEVKPHSSIDPNFYRIYRADEGIDVVKSVSAGINRVHSYTFQTTIQELSSLFDGTEELMTITIRPWYVRQVFLP
jgi:hypothetical protein